MRSEYQRSVHGRVIAVIDQNRGGKSVTNDAENVIADLAAEFDLSVYRVIYRDTLEVWDQLLVEAGCFAGFRPLGATTLAGALAKLASS